MLPICQHRQRNGTEKTLGNSFNACSKIKDTLSEQEGTVADSSISRWISAGTTEVRVRYLQHTNASSVIKVHDYLRTASGMYDVCNLCSCHPSYDKVRDGWTKHLAPP